MKKKNRILSCLLAVLWCVSLLSGCAEVVEYGAELLIQSLTATPAPTVVPSSSPSLSPSPVPSHAGGDNNTPPENVVGAGGFSLAEIPAYEGQPYVVVNGNQPYFTQQELTATAFEQYEKLDELGRCGVAWASVGQELMPTEDRESISSVKPSGWKTARYDGLVEGNYLYNRCHLIGFQLTGENANKQNLITGTRYLNVDGMLPFENLVADYVKETDHHVMYRVTPIFEGDNLVAHGVLMEGWSVEDEGEGVCFCVYAYNIQPGIQINYATGESQLSEEGIPEWTGSYVVNINTKKLHLPTCSGVSDIREDSREEFSGTKEEALALGYEPCGRCHP